METFLAADDYRARVGRIDVTRAIGDQFSKRKFKRKVALSVDCLASVAHAAQNGRRRDCIANPNAWSKNLR